MNAKSEKKLLYSIFIVSILFLVYLLRRPPIKDWLLAYLFNAFSNILIDAFIVSKRMLSYPVRLFPKVLNSNFLFDTIVYPTIMVLFNQVTRHDSVLLIFSKVFLFTVPILLFEMWAVQNTSFIHWDKGWNWKHSFVSITLKSLLNRLIIEVIRKIDNLRSPHKYSHVFDR
ncbi:CBO0543 family protein [Bacillus sp. JCM 19034]|uniref:CBO0543 family protein n=1 Tax=Bacillus sp. JCM 19034 TaxID=1481928 RepID=UPI0007837DCA|nr:CBO0543 family protein [Bacillus sp. JCM 19034]